MNSILDSMILPFRRYADFSGRSRRTEYWLFQINYVIVTLLFFLFGMVGSIEIGSTILFVGIILLIIPSIAVQIRRLHDQDKSGWFSLINFIPYVGWLIVLVLMLTPGTEGENSYGLDPRET